MIRKTFTLDDETAEKLAALQNIDGFNASYVVRQAIREAYDLQMGYPKNV